MEDKPVPLAASVSDASIDETPDVRGVRRGDPGTLSIKRLPNGMLLCEHHIAETRYDVTQHRCGECHRPHELADADPMELCQMCETLYVEGNRCPACGVALHPQWPAVYCSTACALDDM